MQEPTTQRELTRNKTPFGPYHDSLGLATCIRSEHYNTSYMRRLVALSFNDLRAVSGEEPDGETGRRAYYCTSDRTVLSRLPDG